MHPDIEFGSWVSFNQVMRRSSETRYPRPYERQHWRVWSSTPPTEDSRFGVYLGRRVLQQGYLDYTDGEGNYFVPREFVTVALVCTGPRTNPIYVPLDILKPEY